MKRRFLLFGLLALILAGCAPKSQPLIPDSEAALRWQLFQQRTGSPLAYDVLSGSLRFGPVNDTRRVTYTLWSDCSEEENTRVIRLSVNAGTGTNVANMLFEQGRMLLFLPREGKAYEGLETEENMRRIMGLALPMSMNDLNDFLAGGVLPALDASAPERYHTEGSGGIVYAVTLNGRRCELELDEQALPVRWTVPGSWTLTARYDKAGRPDRLDGVLFSTQGEQRMVLLVKNRRPGTDMPASSLELKIPPGVAIYPLDRQPPDRF
ncbi:hypothetical protein [uncultured Mailhella sp.]|uniref:hypothetical protein n=1 Tax=uncultured Mailhella sp. TaxID=1981031 RepID=UPI0026028214|nr:hypothetical protein [uncultured Mailhella sp.]